MASKPFKKAKSRLPDFLTNVLDVSTNVTAMIAGKRPWNVQDLNNAGHFERSTRQTLCLQPGKDDLIILEYLSAGDAKEALKDSRLTHAQIANGKKVQIANLPKQTTAEMLKEWLDHPQHAFEREPGIAKLLTPEEQKQTYTQAWLCFGSAADACKAVESILFTKPSWHDKVPLPVQWIVSFDANPLPITPELEPPSQLPGKMQWRKMEKAKPVLERLSDSDVPVKSKSALQSLSGSDTTIPMDSRDVRDEWKPASGGGWNDTSGGSGGWNDKPQANGWNDKPTASSGGWNDKPTASSGGFNDKPSGGWNDKSTTSGGFNDRPSTYGGFNDKPAEKEDLWSSAPVKKDVWNEPLPIVPPISSQSRWRTASPPPQARQDYHSQPPSRQDSGWGQDNRTSSWGSREVPPPRNAPPSRNVPPPRRDVPSRNGPPSSRNDSPSIVDELNKHRTNVDDVKCTICHQRGHLKFSCPNRSDPNKVECFNCKQRGHGYGDCPLRKARS